MLDWFFTEDGDIAVGNPQVNEEGRVLYKHEDGVIDTEMGADGRPIRDIEAAYDTDVDKQIILNRLRTDAPDWYHHPTMGGNLTDLIGEPNTRETGDLGALYISNALTYQGLYNSAQLSVRAVPISEYEILFFIEIVKYNDSVYRLPLVFNLESGLMDIYQTQEEGVE